jgi:hypothetical protein
VGSLNSFYVMGRVGRAAEQVGTRNGQPVVLFGVTTSAQGRAPIALEAAGPQAEQAMRLRRGQGVFVRGLLRVDVVDERPVLVAQVQALDLVVEGGPPRAPRAPRPDGAEGGEAPAGEGVPTAEGGAPLGGEGQPDDEAIDAAPDNAPEDGLGARRRPRRRRGRGRRGDGPRPEGGSGGNGEGASAPPPRPELPPPAPIAQQPARPVQPPSDPTYRSDMPF